MSNGTEDEGIDMNSFELASSVGNASNILNNAISNRCSSHLSTSTSKRPASYHSNVITFKRNNLNEFKVKEEDEDEASTANANVENNVTTTNENNNNN